MILIFLLKLFCILFLLLLFLIILILSGTIRYRVCGAWKEEKWNMRAEVSFCSIILRFLFQISSADRQIDLKLFGIRMPLNRKEKAQPHSSEKEKSRNKKKRKKQKKTDWKKKGQILLKYAEEDPDTVSIAVREIKELFLRILPDDMKAEGSFGLEDPALTGQISGFLAMLMAFYPDEIQVIPDFSGTAYFDLQAEAGGSFRLFRILRTAIHLFENKKLREMFFALLA